MQQQLLQPEMQCVLMQYFEDKCNSELTSILQSRKAEWQQLRTAQRVKQGLKIRLEMNVPYIGEQNIYFSAQKSVALCKC